MKVRITPLVTFKELKDRVGETFESEKLANGMYLVRFKSGCFVHLFKDEVEEVANEKETER